MQGRCRRGTDAVEVEQRINELKQRSAETGEREAELTELDRRARAEQLYVAVFGEISAGKSSVIRALAPDAAAQVDVLGGTTRAVSHYSARLPGGHLLTLADVPGTHEVAGSTREQLARDEARIVVLYVCAGDLTRDQDAERWLRGFGNRWCWLEQGRPVRRGNARARAVARALC